MDGEAVNPRPRPSGIPRISRLPVTTKSSIPTPTARKLPTTLPTVNRTVPQPQPQSRLLAPQTRAPLAAPRSISNPRTTTATAPKSLREPSFKKPLPKTQPQQSASRFGASTTSASNTKSQVEAEDELGDLDGFRTASRASSRIGYRSGEDEQVQNDGPTTPAARKPRLSLTERTMESLANVPPTPGSKRRSSFFQPESPMHPPSRPASALSNRSHNGGTEGSSVVDGQKAPGRVGRPIGMARQTPVALRPATGRPMDDGSTPRARSPTKASTSRSLGRPAASSTPTATPSTVKKLTKPLASASKTVSGRLGTSGASRPSLTGAPSSSTHASSSQPPQKTARPAVRPTKRAVAQPSAVESSPKPSPNAAKSSAALREQIRRAKAERRSLTTKQIQPLAAADGHIQIDEDLHADPFNQQPKNLVIRKRIDAARTEGRLNIAAMGFKEIPEEILKMYDYEFNQDSSIPWNEVVDLNRFIAADNEIATISDAIFPDADGATDDDDATPPQFGGIDTLDLHGNLLSSLPVGLRRLEQLSVLNLSRNRLPNDTLEVIVQIHSLRDLKLADNVLTGEFPASIGQLVNLEVLELQNNKITALPDDIGNLTNLRTLNISNNQISAIPIASLSSTSLVELLASKNQLNGSLFPADGTAQPLLRLQNIDVSINRLESLCEASTTLPSLPSLPCLSILNIAFNRATTLPDLSNAPKLTSLFCEDNNISALPEGFLELENLRTADFTGNDFSKLDERIAGMASLASFVVAANPLRERKFLTMKTPELMEELRGRLERPAAQPLLFS